MGVRHMKKIWKIWQGSFVKQEDYTRNLYPVLW